MVLVLIVESVLLKIVLFCTFPQSFDMIKNWHLQHSFKPPKMHFLVEKKVAVISRSPFHVSLLVAVPTSASFLNWLFPELM